MKTIETVKFIAHGMYTVSNCGGYLVELSDCGDSARLMDNFGGEDPKISEWLEIQYVYVEDNSDEPCPIIDPEGYNIPLNQVMRIK